MKKDTYIPAFFANPSIFITGETGFLGKALIEKLLRSCPDIAKIYLLIRPKKELDINERLKKMLENKMNLYLIMRINIRNAQCM
jgi:fatty acyl-CoA reductase